MSNTKYLANSHQWQGQEKGLVTLDTDVVLLVRELEQACAERGLTLSRWQTNHSRFALAITWAAHQGERPAQSRYLADHWPMVKLSQLEGKTKRCQAYRLLSVLLEKVRQFPEEENYG